MEIKSGHQEIKFIVGNSFDEATKNTNEFLKANDTAGWNVVNYQRFGVGMAEVAVGVILAR